MMDYYYQIGKVNDVVAIETSPEVMAIINPNYKQITSQEFVSRILKAGKNNG